MKLSKAINFQNVEALSQALRSGRVLRERFSIEIPVNDCANALYAAFKQEVEFLGGEFIKDKDTLDHILSAARWLTDPKGTPGLLMCGLYGNGKTTLARAMQRFIVWITEYELGYSNGKKVRFLKAKEIVRLMRTDTKLFNKLFEEEMIIIDELGEEAKEVLSYGMVDTPMIDLISDRYDKRLFTIITTNLNTDEIKAKYGERIYDRLQEIITSIVFENESYRERK